MRLNPSLEVYGKGQLQESVPIGRHSFLDGLPVDPFDGRFNTIVDLDLLNRKPAKRVTRFAAAVVSAPGAVAVTSLSAPMPQVDVVFRCDRARTLDVSIGTAAEAVRAAFGGDVATQFVGPDGTEDVDEIYPQAAQGSLRSIRRIPIRAGNGSIVFMGDIADLYQAPTPPLISRIDRHNVVYVSANIAPSGALSTVQRAFSRRLQALHLPANVSVAPVEGGNVASVNATIVEMSLSLALY